MQLAHGLSYLSPIRFFPTKVSLKLLHMGFLIFHPLDFSLLRFLYIFERKFFSWPSGLHYHFPFSPSQLNILQKVFPPHFFFFSPSFYLKSTLSNTPQKIKTVGKSMWRERRSETIIHIMGPICSEREIKTRPGKGNKYGRRR